MNTLSIGELARRTGVRASALRYYEDCGLLPAPARVRGRRVYLADVVRRVNLLRFAQQTGFTLGEIKTLLQAMDTSRPLSARWQEMARRKMVELDVLAARVRDMKRALARSLGCGCMRAEDCSLAPADVRAGAPRSRPSRGTGAS